MTTIGVLKERKTGERRVALTPEAVREFVSCGKRVEVEIDAGVGSGFSNDDYRAAGATTLAHPEDVVEASDIIVKVKELQPKEYELIPLMLGKTLFAYLHLAGVEKRLTELLCEQCVTAIPFEAVWYEDKRGRHYPLLEPMSRIAGREAVRSAWSHVSHAASGLVQTMVVGAGVAGMAAVEEILQYGHVHVAVLERDPQRRESVERRYWSNSRVSVHSATPANFAVFTESAHLVVSAVMAPGSAKAPIVISRDLFDRMRNGAYIADIAIDQGGSTAWSKPTKPGGVRVKKNAKGNTITLSCVPNIPGSTVPGEATNALSAAIVPYLMTLAENAPQHLSLVDPRIDRAIATIYGRVMHPAIAEAHHLEHLLAKPLVGDAS